MTSRTDALIAQAFNDAARDELAKADDAIWRYQNASMWGSERQDLMIEVAQHAYAARLLANLSKDRLRR